MSKLSLCACALQICRKGVCDLVFYITRESTLVSPRVRGLAAVRANSPVYFDLKTRCSMRPPQTGIFSADPKLCGAHDYKTTYYIGDTTVTEDTLKTWVTGLDVLW